MTQLAFDLADKYRNPVLIAADGMIGQMMEPIEWKELEKMDLPPKDWATTGTKGKRSHNIVNSLFIDAVGCDIHNQHLDKKYKEIEANEIRWEEIDTEDAEVLFVAYGTPSRIAMSAAELLKADGIKAGLFRPKTLWPYPMQQLREAIMRPSVKAVVCVEMSMGQMVEDVRYAALDKKPVSFCGKAGGVIPTQHEIAAAAKAALGR